MRKSIITVVGKDRVGIIASVCTYLAKHNVNILDISQTIVDGFFNRFHHPLTAFGAISSFDRFPEIKQ